MFTGCATTITEQHDLSYTEEGDPLRDVTTSTKTRAFFASQAKMTEVIITNSDEEQQTAIGETTTQSEEKLAELVAALEELAVEVKTLMPR